MTLEPNPVLTVVVIATAPRCESTTERCEVPWSSGFMDCAYCPPYAVKSRVELSLICCLLCKHSTALRCSRGKSRQLIQQCLLFLFPLFPLLLACACHSSETHTTMRFVATWAKSVTYADHSCEHGRFWIAML